MPIQGDQNNGGSGDTGRCSSGMAVERESEDGRFFSAGKGELAGSQCLQESKRIFRIGRVQ